MMHRRRGIATGLLAAAALAAAAGCGGGPETGPGVVRWDRDVCARCSMVVSDRHHAAQVRGGPAGERARLRFFDDFGCAVLWLDGQTWRAEPGIGIWVTDSDSGDWIDARTAAWIEVPSTPMDYGFGAVREAREGSLDFERAAERIRGRERSR